MKNKRDFLPELLAPAGDMNALVSAIYAGADAVYFGTDLFNARIRANNFDLDSAREAIRLCHAHGVKAFVALNISIYDKEIPKVLEYVKSLYESGADALIVADLGVMTLIRKYFPDFEIHASTQASVHNIDGVKALAELGCSRVVVARELDKQSITNICATDVAEIEIFVHGAHCMSMSGQCLMSYAMGGRSGNRGECAQPCRLPYSFGNGMSYPLSLKDMSLSNHIIDILQTGASSLKIEGRMKSEDYVRGAVEIWRALLDGKRNATKGEISRLEGLFSRQGFTDGYFESRVDENMLGTRTEHDKEKTSLAKSVPIELKKPRLNIHAKFIKGEGATITVSCGEKSATACENIVEEAISHPMTEENLAKNLSKLGSTPYSLGELKIEKSENIMVRVSSLNALRRKAIDKLLTLGREEKTIDYVAKKRIKEGKTIRTAEFQNPYQVPYNASEYFDIIFLPHFIFDNDCGANGIVMPPIILDSDWKWIREALERARKQGAKYALVTNIGQVNVVKELGFVPIADFRFNVFNGHTIDYLESLGFEHIILSPELTLPQCRDMSGYSVIAYGHIPVMTTFKCLLKDQGLCKSCHGYLTDRTGAKMYCDGIYGHHNVIYNSVPIYMADKQNDIKNHSWHFIFTDETSEDCAEIIESYKYAIPTSKKVRRIRA